MASLTSSAVTILREWQESSRNGSFVLRRKHVSCVLTGQGGTTNKIPASVFGLEEIHNVSNAVTSTNELIPAGVSPSRDSVLLASLVQATDADRADAADITATVTFVVEGV